MRTQQEIEARDRVLLAADALVHAVLGKPVLPMTDLDQRMALKRQILDVIDEVQR